MIKKLIPSKIKHKIKEELKRNGSIKAYTDMCKYEPGFVLLDRFSGTSKGRREGDLQYYSQFYQDYYLDKYIFNGKTQGFFLDIGGNDPQFINNTYFFEKTRDWKGLAFEPIPTINKKWDCRLTECLPVALGSVNGETEFCEYEDDYMSGNEQTVDYKGKVKEKYRVKVRKLYDILKERGIDHIDFASIDVEGMELDVLKGACLDRISIDYIVVENNKGKKKERQIRDYLYLNGYRLKARLWIDDVWERIK